jgi:ERCC4-type nuclease
MYITFKHIHIPYIRMNIIIDHRETKLIPLITRLNITYDLPHNIIVKPLDIGDIIIQHVSGENLIIIERKNINDLATSIRDGRYREQSCRLNASEIPNHNIIYMIEGHIQCYNSKFNKIKPATLYSCVCSLHYYKGFSVFKTTCITETAETIIRMTDKIHRSSCITGFYNTDIKQTNPSNEYINHIKIKKKDNITKDNILIIMLAQIPSVNIKTATCIANKYPTMQSLLTNLQQNKQCLNDISHTHKNNKSRKISHKAISNIIDFLL